MQIRSKYLILLLFITCSIHVRGTDVFKQGLFFHSYELDKDKRTCLNLTPDKPLTFNDGFTMEFDVKLRNYRQNFGYVFRIIANDTLNIDFLLNLDYRPASFSLITKNRAILRYEKTEIGNPAEDAWIKTKLTISPSDNTISLSLDGIEKQETYLMDGINQFNIYFGGNAHNLFSTTDIAPMTIKNIRLFDSKSNLVRHWKLDAHADNAVYDECKRAKAEVVNPEWEINKHIKWKERASFSLPGSSYGITFDNVNNRIFVVKEEKIVQYNAQTHLIDTIHASHGIPLDAGTNHLEYNPQKDQLISYQFESNDLVTFDFQTQTWDNENKTVVPPRHTHHSNCYISEDSLLIAFGGYGFHRYKSILYKYDSKNKAWTDYDLLKTITPRYLGSMGYWGNKKILYFGGFGNESGLQEEFPRNFYDLFYIDIEKGTAEKIWELPNPEEHYTNSNSMIVDKNNRNFYVLSYPNQRYASNIRLHAYNLDKSEYFTLGDSIPYFFNDVDSYCDLYLNSDSTELYAVTSYVENRNTKIAIYSMAYPPLPSEDVIQQIGKKRQSAWIWPLLVIILAGMFILFSLYKKKKAKKTILKAQTSNDEEYPIIYDTLFVEKEPSSISLLGNFQVIDTKGNDITKNFTPTTTQLFLLLLISTAKNGQGITSQELRKILWYDKSDESARNNRNVYINKLRSILKPFEEIKVVNNEGNWTIQSDKNIRCDYEKILVLIKMLKNSDRFNSKLLTELVDIALKGTLLPYIPQSEWIESYQSDYTNQLIECLMEYCKHNEVKADLMLLLKMADVIQLHDNIDEEAIRMKCYALYHLGRKNQALQAFNKFTTDYEYLLATKHNLIFDKLILEA